MRNEDIRRKHKFDIQIVKQYISLNPSVARSLASLGPFHSLFKMHGQSVVNIDPYT